MGKLTTSLNVNSGAIDSDEHSFDVEITYVVQRGCAATHTAPGEDDSATIKSVSVIEAGGRRHEAGWLIGLIEDDPEIIGACLQDWEEDRVAAAEYRADAAREDRLFA